MRSLLTSTVLIVRVFSPIVKGQLPVVQPTQRKKPGPGLAAFVGWLTRQFLFLYGCGQRQVDFPGTSGR